MVRRVPKTDAMEAGGGASLDLANRKAPTCPPHRTKSSWSQLAAMAPVQMTAAIAVEGEERPDIRRNACNQVGHAMLGSAIQFTQQFIADRANLILGHPSVGKHGKFPIACDLTR